MFKPPRIPPPSPAHAAVDRFVQDTHGHLERIHDLRDLRKKTVEWLTPSGGKDTGPALTEIRDRIVETIDRVLKAMPVPEHRPPVAKASG